MKALATRIQQVMEKNEGFAVTKGHATIFHEYLQRPELPQAERSLTHLTELSQGLVGAAQMTTTYHLYCTSFHILNDLEIVSTLKRELTSVMSDPIQMPPLAQLEALEYLSAVITEGHRITIGCMHRLPRVSPKFPMQYGEWSIPPGTPTSMSIFSIHFDEVVFPSPYVFDPSRFLGLEGQKRKRFVMPFGKGTRSCIGQNLANAELCMTLAAIFRRFDFELYATSRADVDIAHDYIAHLPRKGSNGVRVLVT